MSTCATIFLLLSEQGNTPQPAGTADFSREGKILHNMQWKPAHLAGFTCFNGSIYPHVQGFTAFGGGKSPQLRSVCPPTGKVMRRFCLLPKMPASCPRNALVYLQCTCSITLRSFTVCVLFERSVRYYRVSFISFPLRFLMIYEGRPRANLF